MKKTQTKYNNFYLFDVFFIYLYELRLIFFFYQSNLFLTILSATAKKITSNVAIMNFSYLAFRSYWLIRSRDVFIKCSFRLYLSIVFDIVNDESAK